MLGSSKGEEAFKMAIEIKEFVGHTPKKVNEQSEKKTQKNIKKGQKTRTDKDNKQGE